MQEQYLGNSQIIIKVEDWKTHVDNVTTTDHLELVLSAGLTLSEPIQKSEESLLHCQFKI